jgi:hypothetical protein
MNVVLKYLSYIILEAYFVLKVFNLIIAKAA